MKNVLIVASIAALVAALALPSWAYLGWGSPTYGNQVSGPFSGPPAINRGPQQNDTRQGYHIQDYYPPYGYWGTGPDYGNYRWPFTGPYNDRPRGRPMDALTYAPFPIEADRGSVDLLNPGLIRASWPGGPQGVASVDFAILGEAGEVLASATVMQYPFTVNMPLPDPAQKVRVTIHYCDNGFSTAVFWIQPK